MGGVSLSLGEEIQNKGVPGEGASPAGILSITEQQSESWRRERMVGEGQRME